MLSVMVGSWCQGLAVLFENITLRMNFCFLLEHWTLSCVLSGWRIGPFRDYLRREDASTKTYEGELVTGRVGGAGNNMSNFINGRERL